MLDKMNEILELDPLWFLYAIGMLPLYGLFIVMGYLLDA